MNYLCMLYSVEVFNKTYDSALIAERGFDYPVLCLYSRTADLLDTFAIFIGIFARAVFIVAICDFFCFWVPAVRAYARRAGQFSDPH